MDRVRPARSPVAAVLAFVGAGLLGGCALLGVGLWASDDDEADVALVAGAVAALLATGLVWLGVRHCRRVFGWSRLGTALVASAAVAGTALVLLALLL